MRISIDKLPNVEPKNLKHLIRYCNFINSRPERKLHQKGFHTHHIYPKSLAKKDDVQDYDGDWNLIELTPREHFIAHLILWKCGYRNMSFAFFRMVTCGKYFEKINSRQYESLISSIREENILRLKDTVWINNGTNSKQVKPDEIPKGWDIGMVGDRQWINNGTENRYILTTEEVPAGFSKGRLSIGYWVHNDKEEKYTNEDVVPQGYEIGRLLTTTKNTKWITDGKINKMIPKEQELPKGYKEGMTTDVKGYRLITNGKNTKYLYDNETIPEGWQYGSTQDKQYVTWINDGEINKRWDMSKELPEGFILGRIVKGFFITNGKIAKKVNSENEIPEGWKRGRLKRTKEQILKNITI